MDTIRTIEIKFAELCDEIDYWKEEAAHWKGKYDEAKKRHIQTINESTQQNYNVLGTVFSALLDPNSTISKGLKQSAKEDLVQ